MLSDIKLKGINNSHGDFLGALISIRTHLNQIMICSLILQNKAAPGGHFPCEVGGHLGIGTHGGGAKWQLDIPHGRAEYPDDDPGLVHLNPCRIRVYSREGRRAVGCAYLTSNK